jgi:hypothetical protein
MLVLKISLLASGQKYFFLSFISTVAQLSDIHHDIQYLLTCLFFEMQDGGIPIVESVLREGP